MALIDDYTKEEKIQGVIYSMSPSAGFEHADVNGNIYTIIRNQLKDSLCKIYMENADLYMDETEQEYAIPDIMVVCDRKGFKKNTRKYFGVPKFVVETLSPSTAKKDKTVKKDLYARKGICEYWIVDYKAKSFDIFYLIDDKYELQDSIILVDDPEDEAYNADKKIVLREFPNIFVTPQDIFQGVGEE